MRGHEEIVSVLLAHGANFDPKNLYNIKVLEIVKKWGIRAWSNFLLKTVLSTQLRVRLNKNQTEGYDVQYLQDWCSREVVAVAWRARQYPALPPSIIKAQTKPLASRMRLSNQSIIYQVELD